VPTVQDAPAGRQQVRLVVPHVAPLAAQQSENWRQGVPGGPHAQTPFVQMPVQHSVPPPQMAPTWPQHLPFWQVPAQQSPERAQAPPLGAQQFAPPQRRPGQQSASPAQKCDAVEQHLLVVAEHV
jgi:hypothetical protein